MALLQGLDTLGSGTGVLPQRRLRNHGLRLTRLSLQRLLTGAGIARPITTPRIDIRLPQRPARLAVLRGRLGRGRDAQKQRHVRTG